MLKRLLFASAALACSLSPIWAQTYRDANGTVAPGFVPLIGCAAGAPCSGPISTTNPLPVAVVSGGGGGGGGGGGTVTQGTSASASGAWPFYQTVGGVAVSASNGAFVNPATGAVFPVSGSVSVTGTTTVAGTVSAVQSGAWSVGRTWSLTSGSDSITVSNFPATQPVSGTVNTVAVNPTSIYAGQQVCAVTAAALSSQALANGVVVKALRSNAGTVFVGASGVTTATGYPLVAGESISYAVSNLSAIYMICQNNSDSVAVTGN